MLQAPVELSELPPIFLARCAAAAAPAAGAGGLIVMHESDPNAVVSKILVG